MENKYVYVLRIIEITVNAVIKAHEKWIIAQKNDNFRMKLKKKKFWSQGKNIL